MASIKFYATTHNAGMIYNVFYIIDKYEEIFFGSFDSKESALSAIDLSILASLDSWEHFEIREIEINKVYLD